MLCEIATLIHADLALKFEVALVCDDDDGERVLILHAEDLLVERAYFLERVPRSDRVDEQKPFAGPHVLLAHGTVFFLAGCVQNIEEGNLVVDDALFPVGILDGRVIFVDKVALYELDGEGRFSDATTADDYQLIFSEKLSPGHL